MSAPGVRRGATERTVSHRLVVLHALTRAQFRELRRLCRQDHHHERFKDWAPTFDFHPAPEVFGAACAYAASEGLRFRTETTVAVSYEPDQGAPDAAALADEGDAFSIDDDRLNAWLTPRANERGTRVDSDDITVDDMHSDALHEAMADDVRELIEGGILRQPRDWNVRVFPLEDDRRWAYLVTVTASDDAKDEGAPTFHIAEGVDEVWSARGVRQHIEDVVVTANNLLYLARAARIGTDPHATHHPDGMCKAHGDYDCGEDDCQR